MTFACAVLIIIITVDFVWEPRPRTRKKNYPYLCRSMSIRSRSLQFRVAHDSRPWKGGRSGEGRAESRYRVYRNDFAIIPNPPWCFKDKPRVALGSILLCRSVLAVWRSSTTVIKELHHRYSCDTYKYINLQKYYYWTTK